MLIWFLYENRIHISVSNRSEHDGNKNSICEENIASPKKKSIFNEVKSTLSEVWEETASNHSGKYFAYFYILQIVLTIILFFIIGMPFSFIFGWESGAFYIIIILVSAGLGNISAEEIVKKIKKSNDNR